MLNVNRMSRTIGGNGSTTIDRTARTPTGTPTPVRIKSRIVGMDGVLVAVAISVFRLVDRRIDIGRRGRIHAAAARGLELVDVGENLGNRYVQRRRNLATNLRAPEQGARERRRRKAGYEAFGCDFTDPGGNDI